MAITMGHLNTLHLAYTDVYINDFITVPQGDTAFYSTLDILIQSICSSDIITLFCTKAVSDIIVQIRCCGI